MELQSYSEQVRKVAPYLNLGVVLVSCVGMGVALGYWLDEKWNTKPWLLISGSLFGIAVGFYHFFKTIQFLEQQEKEKRSPKSDEDR
jgi:F0F1-type ATP synthase assembly protein I